MKSLFTKGLEHFHGTAMEHLWRDSTHPVVRLDLALLASAGDAVKTRLDELVAFAFKSTGFHHDAAAPDVMAELHDHLGRLESGSVVLLIDNADAAFGAVINDPAAFETVRRALGRFFELIRSRDEVWRLVFITTLSRIAPLFPGLAHFTDLTAESEAASLVGFTEEEIERFLPEHLAYASRIFGVEPRELLNMLAAHSGGWCFDRRMSAPVLAPWTVLKVLSSPADGLHSYWAWNGGRPPVLREWARTHALRTAQEYDALSPVGLEALCAPPDPAGLDDVGLLTAAGLLTIRGTRDGLMLLAPPNGEAREWLAVLQGEQSV